MKTSSSVKRDVPQKQRHQVLRRAFARIVFTRHHSHFATRDGNFRNRGRINALIARRHQFQRTRQRRPQLDAVHRHLSFVVRQRCFCVNDAAPRGHPLRAARTDDTDMSGRIAMLVATG